MPRVTSLARRTDSEEKSVAHLSNDGMSARLRAESSETERPEVDCEERYAPIERTPAAGASQASGDELRRYGDWEVRDCGKRRRARAGITQRRRASIDILRENAGVKAGFGCAAVIILCALCSLSVSACIRYPSGSNRAWKNLRYFGSYTMFSPLMFFRFSYTACTDSTRTSQCACV